tara:strand:+ start:3157 stop:3426 length:270 start_codon:yes stop_codon:yes gene_type:complete
MSNHKNIIFKINPFSRAILNESNFGWNNLINANGILGLIIFILPIAVLSGNLKKDRLPLFILFLGVYHYRAIFLTAGQILIAKSIMKDK